MDMRKNVLWRVPLYCILAGIVSFYLIVLILGRFAIVTLPDGSLTADSTRSLIIYGFVFAATVLIGGLFFFHKMTKRELYFSSKIMVSLQLIILLIQYVSDGITSPLGLFFANVSMTSEWSRFISQIVFRFTDNIWISSLVEAFAPCIFILFGQKKLKQAASE